jgi:hypothetical protein
MNSWIEQLEPIIEEYKDGDDTPLTSEEVERLALIIRFKIDVREGNISDEDIEKAIEEHGESPEKASYH